MASIIQRINTAGFLKIIKERVHLQCHVKPNSSARKAGIKPFSDTSSSLEVCVTSPARDNEANEGVIEVLSSLLKCPKSDLEVIRGKKSRDKTIAVEGLGDLKNDPRGVLERVRERLLVSIKDANCRSIMGN
ncbi:hypothetical protein SBOR_2784 [Sclerotinia borealis F-4128]|uniref:YggU family protein n=1 Tax=Sclerotinia borealis (strain F-4128) TaxID=1432307 RepID=W9CQT7_SCLBF|nr:hypothetical protein SBOR_2784 [Sclerotinia borealis F-4128]